MLNLMAHEVITGPWSVKGVYMRGYVM